MGRRQGQGGPFGKGTYEDLIRQPFGLTPSPCAGKALRAADSRPYGEDWAFGTGHGLDAVPYEAQEDGCV